MKNIALSAVAVLAMSSFAVAGGSIAPIEEPVVVEEVVVVENLDAGFYLGLGYGYLNLTADMNVGPATITDLVDDSFGEIVLQAGYKFNAYVAIEGRYWFGMNDLSGLYDFEGDLLNTDASLDAWGIYVKPMYPVTAAFDIYALLGYATSTLDEDVNLLGGTLSQSTDLDGFSWGIGAEYAFNQNVSIFIDYVSIYSDTYEETFTAYDRVEMDVDAAVIDFGVTYKF